MSCHFLPCSSLEFLDFLLQSLQCLLDLVHSTMQGRLQQKGSDGRMDGWTIADAWDLITYRLCHSGPLVKKDFKTRRPGLGSGGGLQRGSLQLFNCYSNEVIYKKVRLKHQSHQPKFNVTSRFLPSHMCTSCCLVGGLGRRCDIAISRLVLSGHLCWLRRNRYASIQHVIHVIFWEVLIHSIGVHHPSPCQPSPKSQPAASEDWQRKAYLGALDFHMSSYMSHPNLPTEKMMQSSTLEQQCRMENLSSHVFWIVLM